MRCYHFGNYYMSSIQQGIQAAHCQMELFVKYENAIVPGYVTNQKRDLYDWAENHKTMICLSAGNNNQLKEIKELFGQKDNTYPWSYFCEDEDSLGGILTNICIVLPESIYETAAKIRSGVFVLIGNKVFDKYCIEKFNPARAKMTLNNFEVELIQLLNSCQLAR